MSNEPEPAWMVYRCVEKALADLSPLDLVLVACSGGADSLALAAAAASLCASGKVRAGAVIIDHQLQSGSGDVAVEAARQCRSLGLEPVERLSVDVRSGPGIGGPEAAARDARRSALLSAADRHNAKALLLGHTLDDQAETVLLGLARGSGARSLAGMASVDGRWRRPLLGCRRAVVRAACAAAGLNPHEDPHNADPAFSRVRVRQEVLPMLEEQLGPGIAGALARTAQLLRSDTEALDGWAERELAERIAGTEPDITVEIGRGASSLGQLPQAVRTRVIRLAALRAGCPPGSLTQSHLAAADKLISAWRGQGAVRLTANRELLRASDKLVINDAGPLKPTTESV